jgi:3-deoxy-manno-octulosonate cytidylyltransferase (CMP-KDO synthetase)
MAVHIADRVVVATDSEAVASAASGAGAEVAMTSAEHRSGTDRVAEVAARAEYAGYDVIVNVQGDEPYIGAESVHGAAGLVERGRFPLATAACRGTPEILLDTSVVKVVTDSHDRALYFSRAPIPFLRNASDRAQRDVVLRQHIGVYAYTRDALARWVTLPPHPLEISEQLEQLRPIADGIAMGVATVVPSASAGIDTEEDLASANARWPGEQPSAAGAH